MFVHRHNVRRAFFLRQCHRHNLLREFSRIDRGDGALMRRQRKFILRGARNFFFHFRDIFGGLAHRFERKHLLHAFIRKTPAERRIVQRRIARLKRRGIFRQRVRRARHGFDAARHIRRAFAGFDRVRGMVDCRQTRRAQTVECQRRDFFWKTRQQRRHARDIAIVFARLIRAAEIHLFDVRGVHARAFHNFLQHERGEVVGARGAQHAAVSSNRRTYRFNNHCLRHSFSFIKKSRFIIRELLMQSINKKTESLARFCCAVSSLCPYKVTPSKVTRTPFSCASVRASAVMPCPPTAGATTGKTRRKISARRAARSMSSG
ncbi:MAG: hypothetical protein HDKAJFGB_03174 [Anaerolineae bacterium]|nr:hypothetical protein [Anaerolineae bacterium]